MQLLMPASSVLNDVTNAHLEWLICEIELCCSLLEIVGEKEIYPEFEPRRSWDVTAERL